MTEIDVEDALFSKEVLALSRRWQAADRAYVVLPICLCRF